MNVLVRHQSTIRQGVAHLTLSGKSIIQGVKLFYSDGRVKTSSGDVWDVSKSSHKDYSYVTVEPISV